MATFSMPFAIFTLFIVVADIIMALCLCFTLPYHASRLHYYPPYGRIVDIDTATIYCPCLNKYLDEFRGKLDVKFVKPPKDAANRTSGTGEFTNPKIKSKSKKKSTVFVSEIDKYPYVASVTTRNMTCDGVVSTLGMIAISRQCGDKMGKLVNATARTGSNYISKFGSVYKIVEMFKDAGSFTYLYVEPPIPDSVAKKGIVVPLENFKYHVISDKDLLSIHSWNMPKDETSEVFETVFYWKSKKCGDQKDAQYCLNNQEIGNVRLLLNHCKKILVGVQFDSINMNFITNTTHHLKYCKRIYKGSCMTEEEEASYCVNHENKKEN